MSIKNRPLTIALANGDGTHRRIETGLVIGYDKQRKEVVFPFRDSADADTQLRMLRGVVVRASEAAGEQLFGLMPRFPDDPSPQPPAIEGDPA